MSRPNRRLLPLFVVCASALPACYQLEVTAHAGAAQIGLSGDLGYFESQPTGSSSTFPPPTQDIDSAFGIGNSQTAPYGLVSIDTGVPVLTVSAFSYKTSGEGDLAVGFGGIQPSGGASVPVSSDFEVLDIKTTYCFEVPIGPVTIGPGIGLDYLDMKLRVVNQLDPAEVQTANLSVPVPFVLLRGEVDLKWFDLVAEVGYMSADVEDLEARLVDIEAMAIFRPAHWVHLFVGYRQLVLDAKGYVDDDYVDADVTLQGPMIGGGFRF